MLLLSKVLKPLPGLSFFTFVHSLPAVYQIFLWLNSNSRPRVPIQCQKQQLHQLSPNHCPNKIVKLIVCPKFPIKKFTIFKPCSHLSQVEAAVAEASLQIIGKISYYSQCNCLSQFAVDSQHSVNQPLRSRYMEFYTLTPLWFTTSGPWRLEGPSLWSKVVVPLFVLGRETMRMRWL